MKKRTAAALALPVALLITAVILCSWPSNEPVYKGKRVREYIYGTLARVPDHNTDDAFVFFGTNAVPYVRAVLRARDTWNRKALLCVAAKAPWLKITVRSASSEHAAGLAAYRLIMGLDSWGDARGACESEVRDLMDDPDLGVDSVADNLLLDLAPTPEQRAKIIQNLLRIRRAWE